MKIVHVCAHQDGGAGRAALRLHEGLRRIGQDSIFFAGNVVQEGEGIVAFDGRAKVFTRVRRKLRRDRIEADLRNYSKNRGKGQEFFSDDRSELGPEVRLQLPPSDIVHLHWIAGYADYVDFLSMVPQKTPVVWTLHDMNPFTGGCHYDEGCGRFAGACGACPELGSKVEEDLSRQIWERKRKALRAVPPGCLQIEADSAWLASQARKSSLFGKLRVGAIHYSLDVEKFRPRGRAATRTVLGVPSNAKIVLFVADHPEIKRKGFATLVEALSGLTEVRGLLLMSMGRTKPEFTERFEHLHLGYVIEEHFQSIIYSAADLFVMPSLQEAFGQTALESMACGTPVVGSDAGGFLRSCATARQGWWFRPAIRNCWRRRSRTSWKRRSKERGWRPNAGGSRWKSTHLRFKRNST